MRSLLTRNRVHDFQKSELQRYDMVRDVAAAECDLIYALRVDLDTLTADKDTEQDGWELTIPTDGRHKYDGTGAR